MPLIPENLHPSWEMHLNSVRYINGLIISKPKGPVFKCDTHGRPRLSRYPHTTMERHHDTMPLILIVVFEKYNESELYIMIYGEKYNIFLNDSTEKSNEEKLEALKDYSVDDTLALLRNIEESPSKYDKEIIQGVYNILFAKGIMCV